MKARLKVNDWGNPGVKEVDTQVTAQGKQPTNVSFSYDGGRLLVYLNGKEVYKNMGCSHDVSVSLEFGQ